MVMPLRWTKSLRFQLSLWSLATTALILLAASVVCYGLVRSALRRETDQALVETTAALLRRMAPEEVEPGETSQDTSPAQVVRDARLSPVTLPGVGSDALCLRLARSTTGETVEVSPNLSRDPGLLAVLAALPPQPHPPLFAGSEDDTQLRCFSTRVPHSPYLLQVAAPWDPVEDLLTELVLGLVLASLLFLVLSGVGSGLLVGRALRPIDLIVTEAENLTPDRLGSVQLSPRALSDTEIGHLVAALNRMLARISGSFAAQRQFTADASHELRTPLTILRGQFELALTRDRPAAEYRSTLESGLEEVLRMARIVESLAYLTRGDASVPASRFVPLSLAKLTEEVTASLLRRAAENSLTLTTKTEGATALCGDADALRRLVQNLVENALTYTPAGGMVTVSVTETPQHCILQVADTGVGIAADALPHVFDRFFRADPARVNTGGSGLGLSIVRSIAEAHGGGVEVWSEPGRGSIFTVSLPHEKLLMDSHVLLMLTVYDELSGVQTMTSKTLFTAGLTLASLGTLWAGAALAAPPITPAQAEAAAMRKIPGKAQTAKYEYEDGHWQYAVVVKARQGGLYEVEVSSTTGKVTDTEKTSAAEEASEAAADKKAVGKKAAGH